MSFCRRLKSIKRLAIFVEHFPPFLGSDRSVFELAKRIAEKGIKVHFIVTQPLRYLIGRRPEDWEYKKNWSKPAPTIHKNITAEYLVVGKQMMTFWRIFKPLAYLLTIIQFVIMSIKCIIKFNPRVVIASHASPIVGVTAFLSAKFTARPILMGCPDWMSAYAAGLSNTAMNDFKPVIIQIVEFILYRLSNRVFAATNYLKDLLVEQGLDSTNIVVISNGTDPEIFNPNLDVSGIRKKYRLGESFVVLFIGHLEDWAGVDLIYGLAECLNKRIENSIILLVGSGDSARKLIDRLIRSNLSHMVTHAGLHPYEDMPLFTAVSDVTLCLFPDTPVSHAASPLKLFEYLSAGTAVIATRVAGTVEVLEDNCGMLVKPGNITEICDAVVRLRNDQDLRKELGKNGRKLVQDKYSWSILAEKLIDTCENLMSS